MCIAGTAADGHAHARAHLASGGPEGRALTAEELDYAERDERQRQKLPHPTNNAAPGDYPPWDRQKPRGAGRWRGRVAASPVPPDAITLVPCDIDASLRNSGRAC
ncbi:MAG: hypothetical protein Kow0010_04970 [Dehalococcoidia bacterium]